MITVRSWHDLSRDEFYRIARLRSEVFFVEQRINDIDLDDTDRAPDTEHWWIDAEPQVAAYLRVLRLAAVEHGATLSFGRVAVRRDRRSEGLAQRLIAAVLERHGHEPIVIHSQQYIVNLYRPFGFRVVGEPFLDAGIVHHTMIRPADSVKPAGPETIT